MGGVMDRRPGRTRSKSDASLQRSSELTKPKSLAVVDVLDSPSTKKSRVKQKLHKASFMLNRKKKNVTRKEEQFNQCDENHLIQQTFSEDEHEASDSQRYISFNSSPTVSYSRVKKPE